MINCVSMILASLTKNNSNGFEQNYPWTCNVLREMSEQSDYCADSEFHGDTCSARNNRGP